MQGSVIVSEAAILAVAFTFLAMEYVKRKHDRKMEREKTRKRLRDLELSLTELGMLMSGGSILCLTVADERKRKVMLELNPGLVGLAEEEKDSELENKEHMLLLLLSDIVSNLKVSQDYPAASG